MIRRCTRIIFALILLVTASLAFANTPSHKGIETVLRGAKLGVSFAEFVEMHPEVVYSDAEKRSQPVTKENPDSLLITYEKDPFLGLSSFANFGFRNGNLYEFVAVWTDNPEIVRPQLRLFFNEIISQHGTTYERKSMRVYPNSEDETVVAVFYWETTQAAIMAFYTPSLPSHNQPKASVTYAQFQPNDPILKDVFTDAAPRAEQQEKAWAELTNEMGKLN